MPGEETAGAEQLSKQREQPNANHPDAVATSEGGHNGIDVEAMILRFLADESESSLELPRALSAEQRKQARRLIDQQPGVKCESFGFGAERQLHLFKQGAARPTPQAGTVGQERPPDVPGQEVVVKNTFIDDWAGGSAEPVQFRSMPVSLLQRTLQRCLVEAGEQMDLPATMEELQSTAVSSPRSDTANQVDSEPPSSPAPELPPLPDGLQVRNTFIHIETMPVVNRIVQSMPDGVFQQCLEAELHAQGAAATQAQPSSTAKEARQKPSRSEAGPPLLQTALEPPTAAPLSTPKVAGVDDTTGAEPAPPSRDAPDPNAKAAEPQPAAGLEPGTEVEITKLVKLPQFNGLCGTIQSFDAASGRYDILLSSPTSQCAYRWVKVKADNLIPRVPPPPPREAPMIVTDADDTPSNMLATPKWEEDYVVPSQPRAAGTAALNLNSLV